MLELASQELGLEDPREIASLSSELAFSWYGDLGQPQAQPPFLGQFSWPHVALFRGCSCSRQTDAIPPEESLDVFQPPTLDARAGASMRRRRRFLVQTWRRQPSCVQDRQQV